MIAKVAEKRTFFQSPQTSRKMNSGNVNLFGEVVVVVVVVVDFIYSR